MYKIYKLQSIATDIVYIGCTSQKLSRRFTFHKSHFNTKSNHIVMYDKVRELGLTISDFEIVEITRIKDRVIAYETEQAFIKTYRELTGVFNTEFENHGTRGTKGLLKKNSASFKKGNEIGKETRFKKGSTVGKATRFKKGETNNTAGTITVHKDNKNHRISPDKLEEYLSNGFTKGMKPRMNAKGYSERNGRFQAYLTIDGKLKMLGTYDTKEEAQEVRRKAML